MKVSRIMTSDVVTVGLDDNLGKVYQIFAQHRFHHVLVVKGKTLLGIISDRDLLKSLSPRIGTPMANDYDQAAFKRKVSQIMSRELVVILENESVLQAVRLFNRHRISCLPVVNAEREWVGILSWRDVFRQIEKVKGSSTLLTPEKTTPTEVQLADPDKL
ncbi:CBS domain-containing protein [Lacimicrobium sp. SS2-24]|uniref:CBS domain-containing protein n=1 Tax=Lacimicrobium sp. SS2-24 TaxID=2005569 RepID=UPI000B4B74F0|nr:CBS domain-containing protein [Lacimicrobium sp. SS2-24]